MPGEEAFLTLRKDGVYHVEVNGFVISEFKAPRACKITAFMMAMDQTCELFEGKATSAFPLPATDVSTWENSRTGKKGKGWQAMIEAGTGSYVLRVPRASPVRVVVEP
jgi:hypothetical protein